MPETWIIEAQWVNSTPTHVGPFGTIAEAEEYGRRVMNRNAAVTDWSVWLLDTPAPALHAL